MVITVFRGESIESIALAFGYGIATVGIRPDDWLESKRHLAGRHRNTLLDLGKCLRFFIVSSGEIQEQVE